MAPPYITMPSGQIPAESIQQTCFIQAGLMNLMISSLVHMNLSKAKWIGKGENEFNHWINSGSLKELLNCSALKMDPTLFCFKHIRGHQKKNHSTPLRCQSRCVCRYRYLWYSWVVDLNHYVADQLKYKKPSIQTPKVELILHVIIQNLPPANHLLYTHKGKHTLCVK